MQSVDMAAAIEGRRKELGLSPTELATAAGVTLQGLRPLRKDEVREYQSRLTVGVCRAFGWTPDSIERLMRGEPPHPIATPRAGAADVLALVDQLTAEIARGVAERAALEHLVTSTVAELQSSIGELRNRIDAVAPPSRPPLPKPRSARSKQP